MAVPIFKEKGNVIHYGVFREVKLPEHAIKVVKRVLKRRIKGLVKLDKIQFGFMPGRETIDALYKLRRKQDEYQNMDKNI